LLEQCNSVGHFSTIVNNEHSKFNLLKYDDWVENVEEFDLFEDINPHLLVYMDVTDSLIEKSIIFTNSMTAKIKENGKLKQIKVFNMCNFNSIFHGLYKFYRVDKLFRKFIAASTRNNSNELFNILIKIFENNTNKNSIVNSNDIWLQYIYNNQIFKDRINKIYNMEGGFEIVEYLFKDFMTFQYICENCGTILRKNSIALPTIEDNNDIKNLQIILENTYNQESRTCNNCQKRGKLKYNQCLVIQTSKKRGFIENIVDPGQEELKFKDLPHGIKLNGNFYRLVFVQHFNENLKHYVTKYCIKSGHLEIDDLGDVELKCNEEFVNPTILFYFSPYYQSE
jgi:hypothetical protein